MEAVAATNLGGRRPPWQDLPSELLALVLQRVLSHADRVRLRAVCRQWRAGARLQPPLLPWLALRDGSFLSLSDGEVHGRGLAPDDNVTHRVSTGSTLFLVHNDKRFSFSLMNPLARGTTAPQRINLSCLRTRRGVLLDAGNIRKVVVMSDHITAVQTGSQVNGGKVITISIRRPQSTTVEWQWQWIPHGGTYWPCPYHVRDMALFRHKLYVLTAAAVGPYLPFRLRLYAMDIVGGNHVNVQRVFMRPQDDVDRWHHGGPRHYLVASGDRLLMVKQTSPLLMPAWFEVLEAADISSGGLGWWRDVETLMGRALFVSEGCSESIPAGDGKYGGARQDCIYFLKEHNNYGGRTSDLYSGVYDMRRGTVSPLPVDTVVPHDGSLTATWFFPPDS
ncbi:uncharacterized protein [Aegilops tauschii subsp. strangulata]|uniref:uncharacterized protein n=1 Tax=Aegilops tauschii subsp. strangulata TaxID=200361 RepID=UPI003CC87DFF